MQYIGIIIFLVLYFSLTPVFNDDTCRALSSTNFGTFDRIAGEFLFLCWVPWD